MYRLQDLALFSRILSSVSADHRNSEQALGGAVFVRARLVVSKGVKGWLPFLVGLLVVGGLLFGSYPGSAESKLN